MGWSQSLFSMIGHIDHHALLAFNRRCANLILAQKCQLGVLACCVIFRKRILCESCVLLVPSFLPI